MDFFFIVEFKNEGIDQKRSYMKRKALSLLLVLLVLLATVHTAKANDPIVWTPINEGLEEKTVVNMAIDPVETDTFICRHIQQRRI